MPSELQIRAPSFWAPPLALTAIFAVLFVWNSWHCDDAFITLRVLDNFVRGEGLRWNVLERVQVFTSPLHALLLAPLYWLLVDPGPLPNPSRAYLASMLFSFGASLAALLVMQRRLRGPWFWPLFALLFSSQAFALFTSSGLETPLIYLILALFFTEFLAPGPESRGSTQRLLLYAMLGVLTRLDLALLLLPASLSVLLAGLRRDGWGTVRAAALATLPAVLWFGFALVYFGFLLPNSFYAKVGGVASPVLLEMGRSYLARSFAEDPVTLVTIALAAVASFASPSRWRLALAALGALLYVGWVVQVGGDFIGFRFLAPPFLVSALVLQHVVSERLRRHREAWAAGGVAAALVYGLATPHSPIRIQWDLPPAPGDVSFYFPASNLARWRPGHEFPFAQFSFTIADSAGCRAMRVHEFSVSSVSSGGLTGFCFGPLRHLVDPLAITDPLLARLPTTISRPFLAGHLVRPLPVGYLQSISTGENRIRDPRLARYWDQLRLVTQGKLFTRERWLAILVLNLRQRSYGGPPLEGRPFGVP